jgi:hypothetical protein
MKICLFGQPRSRSNYLLECLATHNAVQNLSEPYQGLFHKSSPDTYTNDIRDLSNKVFNENESFALKVQTTNMSHHYAPILDFDHFLLNRYDQIYITYRENILDQICSVLLTIKYKRWYWREKPKPEDFIYTFDPIKDWYILYDAHYDLVKLAFLEEYLKTKDLKYKKLEYNDIPNYIDSNLSGSCARSIETGFDFKQQVTNYKLLEHVVKIYFNSIIPQ